MSKVSRRHTLSFLLASVVSIGLPSAVLGTSKPILRPNFVVNRSGREIRELLKFAPVGSDITFVVCDTETGEELESFNPLRSLPPASVMKAITGFYALETLGPEFSFQTRLMTNGSIKNGVLEGDLILVGGGDPTLDTDALYDLSKLLSEFTLKTLTGDFKVYSSDWPSINSIDPDQPSHLSYNPSISGLNLNFNRIFLEWKRKQEGYSLSLEARGLKARPSIEGIKVKLSDRSSPVFEYKKLQNNETWTVARSSLGQTGGRWLPVRNPALYAGQVFQRLAMDAGIDLPAPTVIYSMPKGQILISHESETLKAMTKSMLKHSTNLTAEMLGVTASSNFSPVSSLGASSHKMVRWLEERCNLNGVSLVDHSGLNDQSTISAKSMVNILRDSRMQIQIKPLLKKIPYRRKKGQKIFGDDIKIVGKTGTLHYVSALAGYIDNSKGRNLAFAIFVSDMRKRRNLENHQKENPRGSTSWMNSARYFQRLLINRWCRL